MKFSLDLNWHVYHILENGVLAWIMKCFNCIHYPIHSLYLGKALLGFLDWFQDTCEFSLWVCVWWGFFDLLSFLIAVLLLLLNFPFTTVNCLFILRLWDNGVWSTPSNRKDNYLWPRSTWSLKDAAVVMSNKLIYKCVWNWKRKSA